MGVNLTLDADPPFRTSLRVERALFTSVSGKKVVANLRLEFHSFVAWEPFQTLVRITAEVVKAETGMSDEEHRLSEPVTDTTGVCLIRPFRTLIIGLLAPIKPIELGPMPYLELELAPEDKSNTLGETPRAWGVGITLEDKETEVVHFETSRYVRHDGGTSCLQRGDKLLPFLEYPVELEDGHGRVLVLGKSDHLLSDTANHPDHYVTLPLRAGADLSALGQTLGGLYGLIRATSGLDPCFSSMFSSSVDGTTLARMVPIGTARSMSKPTSMQTVPFRRDGLSPRRLFTECWPRVRRLQLLGFGISAVSEWFQRGQNTNPVEQGFLHLFVFLESLKFHWTRLQDPELAAKTGGFRPKVNATLRDLLGGDHDIKPFVAFRNRMVHEGASGLSADEQCERYWELLSLCSAAYLSLVGWAGPWMTLGRTGARTESAWWTVPDLSRLLPPAGAPSVL